MYLDPGFGGMLVQVVVVIAAMGGAVLFSLRRKIMRLFKKDAPAQDVQATAVDVGDDDVVDMLEGDEK